MKRVEVEVTKEVFEAAQAARAFVSDVRTALADGWDPMTDGPAIAVSALSNATRALDGAKKIPAEFSKNPRAATLGVAVEVIGAVFDLLGR